MSDCCSSNTLTKNHPKKHTCPMDGKQHTEVPYNTVLHHIKQPWKSPPKEQPYYFCDDPDCNVVYFGLDNATIEKEQLRTVVGIKEKSEQALICYCYGVSKKEAQTNSHAKEFVMEQTKNSLCACATRNPSGRCCLKDFPK